MLLNDADIDHLLYIVGESKKKCLEDGGGLRLKPEDMYLSKCSRLYNKLKLIQDSYEAYYKHKRNGITNEN